MSKNNTIKKSDKKFIRLEKARIRAQFFDIKKQEEKINELYQRFTKKDKKSIQSPVKTKTETIKKESQKTEKKDSKEKKVKVKK